MHCEAVAHYRCNLSNQTANKSGSTGAWGVNQRRIAGYECPKSEDGVVLWVTAIWQVAPRRLSVSTNQPIVRKRLADQLKPRREGGFILPLKNEHRDHFLNQSMSVQQQTDKSNSH